MRKILVLAGDFTEDYEVMVPYQALEMIGFNVDVVCPEKKQGEYIKTSIHDFEGYQTYTEKHGHNFMINASFNYLKLEEYDGLYITGGRAPEYLRLNSRIIDIVRYFMELNKPVAAICHGIQILTAADVVKGRKLTAYSAVKPEVLMAGGVFIDKKPNEVVIDNNLVTSPAWPGNTAVLREFLKILKVKIVL
ncbi:MAG: DJ-1/PfpI family protein [Clostridium butyricum]|uniref:DJ-1/PfpI family protein n=2 Tax=Clostridium butyricum TaxID=1492 RepID=UPI0029148F3E|nr:DJ-1/PfpI family protein [Clostridium butyricum]MDU4853163.1 DJ-1/PfpI family protein [Clostridioides difficile]